MWEGVGKLLVSSLGSLQSLVGPSVSQCLHL